MTITLNGTTGITTPAITDVSTGNVAYTGTLTGGTGVFNLGSGQLVKDATGNVGLGVTPSAWGTSVANRALDVGSYAAFGAWGGATVTTFNAYFNASNTATYKLTGVTSAMYLQGTSGHSWHNAPSGTAGNPISFTQAMTLDASGNLLVGIISSPAQVTNNVLSVGGTVITPKYNTSFGAGGGSLTTPIKIGSGNGGGLLLISGNDSGGVAYSNLYNIAIRVASGAGADLAVGLVSNQGSGITFTFSNVGGFLVVSSTSLVGVNVRAIGL